MEPQVKVWRENVVIPTYEVGEPDRNPMFLEKRVYQGSSGKVYPYPVIDKVSDTKRDREYHAVWLENEYLKIMILPELGGRVQRALDKTTGYDFVYYNEVIKPALVGLAGPWISGGIEFNWPQHHRPTTFSPVDCTLCDNPDGSKSVRVSEVDQMYGTKGMAAFTLYPGRAYLEVKGQLYNRTPLWQTFLWWANPAVAVNENTQSIFPPDVTAVMDHGKRDVSAFPIATGVYYKHDYGAGVDISRYKNIPVPTSYMAEHSAYDFVGGYDYGKQAGLLHVADHHVAPGKKQWTWGCGDFGKAWDRNLTDSNGPYIELMTGVFTDNQPDFTWLAPFEEKTFTQYFLPYKKVGQVKNASAEAAMRLEVADGTADLCVYTTAVYENARIVLTADGREVFSAVTTLSPNRVFETSVPVPGCAAHALTLTLYDGAGREMLAYTPAKPSIARMPHPAAALEAPEHIATVEELYLAGTHLEQYRHATFLPDDYYREGLKRDPGDIRCNTAWGTLLLRRGDFTGAEPYLRAAVKRAAWKNANPADGEPSYALGLCLYWQGKDDEACDAFYKATWSDAQQGRAFFWLAVLAAKRSRIADALAFAERALTRNAHNLRARSLKAILLRRLGRAGESAAVCRETLALDPFAYGCAMEQVLHGGADKAPLLAQMRNVPSAFIETAGEFADAGCPDDAVAVLRLCTADSPMLHYYEAFYLAQQGADFMPALCAGAAAGARCCFPNRLSDIAVLRFAMKQNPADAKAPYYLGCLYYDKRQYRQAIACWEQSAAVDASFPTVWRNLAIAYYNKASRKAEAEQCLERAWSLDRTDARVFLELDQLHKKCGRQPAQRIADFEANRAVILERDDLITEYVTLLNLTGRFGEAHALTMSHAFHPWEGGEGKIMAQYALSLRELAKRALAAGDAEKADSLLHKALVFPSNLGEGKLEGAKDNDLYYYLGVAADLQGSRAQAIQYWQRAAVGTEEPAGMMFYNDQPADMILYQGLARRQLGDAAGASSRFYKLVRYGETHLYDEPHIDYFAVSLPDMQLWDEDLARRNRAHCFYLIALGSFGLGDLARAQRASAEACAMDPAHTGAVLHRAVFASGDVLAVI